MAGMTADDAEPTEPPAFVPMRSEHTAFLASELWADMLRTDLLPWLTAQGDLGDDVLEIGPGPGLTTDILREMAARVTAIELDANLADALAGRLAGGNVEVLHGDATDTGMSADRFSSVTSFHMLHHVPSRDLQDALFAEACRVLRPGGMFLVADALDEDWLRQRHVEEGETFVPLDPATVSDRLREAGFADTDTMQNDYQLLVRARKAPA